jgi:hypothetical protein
MCGLLLGHAAFEALGGETQHAVGLDRARFQGRRLPDRSPFGLCNDRRTDVERVGTEACFPVLSRSPVSRFTYLYVPNVIRSQIFPLTLPPNPARILSANYSCAKWQVPVVE